MELGPGPYENWVPVVSSDFFSNDENFPLLPPDSFLNSTGSRSNSYSAPLQDPFALAIKQDTTVPEVGKVSSSCSSSIPISCEESPAQEMIKFDLRQPTSSSTQQGVTVQVIPPAMVPRNWVLVKSTESTSEASVPSRLSIYANPVKGRSTSVIDGKIVAVTATDIAKGHSKTECCFVDSDASQPYIVSISSIEVVVAGDLPKDTVSAVRRNPVDPQKFFFSGNRAYLSSSHSPVFQRLSIRHGSQSFFVCFQLCRASSSPKSGTGGRSKRREKPSDVAIPYPVRPEPVPIVASPVALETSSIEEYQISLKAAADSVISSGQDVILELSDNQLQWLIPRRQQLLENVDLLMFTLLPSGGATRAKQTRAAASECLFSTQYMSYQQFCSLRLPQKALQLLSPDAKNGTFLVYFETSLDGARYIFQVEFSVVLWNSSGLALAPRKRDSDSDDDAPRFSGMFCTSEGAVFLHKVSSPAPFLSSSEASSEDEDSRSADHSWCQQLGATLNEREPTIQVFIDDLLGKVVSLELSPSMKVKQLMETLSKKFGAELVRHCRFVFETKELKDDDATLATYGLTNGCTIRCRLRLRGGGRPQSSHAETEPVTDLHDTKKRVIERMFELLSPGTSIINPRFEENGPSFEADPLSWDADDAEFEPAEERKIPRFVTFGSVGYGKSTLSGLLSGLMSRTDVHIGHAMRATLSNLVESNAATPDPFPKHAGGFMSTQYLTGSPSKWERFVIMDTPGLGSPDTQQTWQDIRQNMNAELDRLIASCRRSCDELEKITFMDSSWNISLQSLSLSASLEKVIRALSTFSRRDRDDETQQSKWLTHLPSLLKDSIGEIKSTITDAFPRMLLSQLLCDIRSMILSIKERQRDFIESRSNIERGIERLRPLASPAGVSAGLLGCLLSPIMLGCIGGCIALPAFMSHSLIVIRPHSFGATVLHPMISSCLAFGVIWKRLSGLQRQLFCFCSAYRLKQQGTSPSAYRAYCGSILLALRNGEPVDVFCLLILLLLMNTTAEQNSRQPAAATK